MNKTTLGRIYFVVLMLVAAGCEHHSGPVNQNLPAPVLSGKLLKPDGNTPAEGVLVTIVPRFETARFTVSGKVKKGSGALVVQTDADGIYRVSALDTGVYVIEGNDNAGNAVRIDSVVVTSTEDAATVEPYSLQSTGSITGRVTLPEGADPSMVFILAFGSERFAQADGNGLFTFSDIPYGRYELQPFCLEEMYGGFQPVTVVVLPDSTADAGLLPLLLDQVYVPQNFICSRYDTMMQTITLQWDYPVNGEKVKGYNIFTGPTTMSAEDCLQLNRDLISENTFTVSTLNVYENNRFYVSAVLQNGVVGEKSTPVDVVRSIGGPIDTLPLVFKVPLNRLNWINDNELELISYGPGANNGADLSGSLMNDQLVSNRFTFNGGKCTVTSTVIYSGMLSLSGSIRVVDNGWCYQSGDSTGIIERLGTDSTDRRLYDFGREIVDFTVVNDCFIVATSNENSNPDHLLEDLTVAAYDSNATMLQLLYKANTGILILTMDVTSDGRVMFNIDNPSDFDFILRMFMVYNPVSQVKEVLSFTYGYPMDMCGDYSAAYTGLERVYEIRKSDGIIDRRIPYSYPPPYGDHYSRTYLAVNSKGAVAIPEPVDENQGIHYTTYRILVLPAR